MTTAPTTSTKVRILDLAIDVGIPLLGIAAFAHQYGQPIGSLSAVGAAFMCGVAVPVFDRYVTKPFLKFSDVGRKSVSGVIFSSACNLALGALSAWVMFH